MVAGTDLWHTVAVPKFGIGAMKLTDGPVGARGAHYTGGAASACFPCGSALAATWDTELVQRVGAELGRQTRSKGAHVLLAPTVNLHRSPLGGRHFECYSEDPVLTARMAVAYISGVQSEGVGACVKHFVCNDSEFERFTISVEVPERALRECYLLPFEAATREAKVWSVMGAYNRVEGTYCCEHPELLTTILRDEWEWDGFVVSDWGATHSTAPAAGAGLDLEMPGPPSHFGSRLSEAVRAGEISEEVVDAQVRRLLVGLERAGVLDGKGDAPLAEQTADGPEVRALAREVAAAAIVLLRNETPTGDLTPLLPLAPDAASIAVIGPNAAVARIQGGGSAGVTPPYAVSPLQGITDRVGAATRVVYEPGVVSARSIPRLEADQLRSPDGGEGFAVDYFANTELHGEPVANRSARLQRSTFIWSGQLDSAEWSVRMTADFIPAWTGVHEFSLTRTGRARLWVNGELAADGWGDDESVGKGATLTPGGRPVFAAEASVTAGEPVRLVLELAPPGEDGAPRGRVGMDLRCRQPPPDDLLERAVRAAADADVAVVVVGLDSDWETEGRDRRELRLPAGQDELVERVLDANPRTVVVVNAGSPVSMDWCDAVPGIVWLWYTGQEMGHALADVLFGDVNPSGRLPTTFPARIQDTPSYIDYPGEQGVVCYGEGVFVGYRWYERRCITPRYAFGHGLSYTCFDYGPVNLERSTIAPDEDLNVSIDVTNTGERAGHEVVQLYVRDVESTVARPDKELRAFTRVLVEPDQTETVTFALGARDWSYWDPSGHAWRAEPGEFEVLIGAASDDIRARAGFRLDSGS